MEIRRGAVVVVREPWEYDEFRHFGVDFADQNEVAAYDRKQGTTIEDEDKLASELGITEGDSVIEYGCGTGCFSVAAAKRCRRVIAIDISKAMLEYASQRAQDLGVRNLYTHHAGFLTYEHEGEPADWIVTKFALHHLPDAWKSVGLARMRGALREGGMFFLRDVVFSFEPDEFSKHVQDWVGQQSGFSREEFESHIRDEFSTYDFVMEALIEQSGFHIQETRTAHPMYADYLCVRN